MPDEHLKITLKALSEEARARLAAIVNSSDDAIIGKTLEGIITTWNPGAERVFGYSAAEAIGQPMLMLFPPERLKEEPEILARIGRGERVDHFETVRIRKDGRRIDVSATISPIVDDHGKIIGASKITRDITERKRVEESRSRLAEIVQGMNEACFALDKDWRFVFVNDRCESLLRHRRDEMLGNLFWTVFAKLLGTPMEQNYRRAMTEHVSVAFEAWSPVAQRWLDIRLFPSGDGLAAFLLDIDARKQVEEALKTAHAQLRQLLEHSPAVIYSLKIEGQKIIPTVVSENMTALLGFTVQEALSYEWWHSHLHPEDRDRAVAGISVTMTQGVSVTEYRMRHKNGSYRWVEDTRRVSATHRISRIILLASGRTLPNENARKMFCIKPRERTPFGENMQ
ncbi:MAG TPA: PAS domain S-box protein [Verrucomicrobiae bacterium]|jgi:PAS domain S-box-containing protein